MPKVVFIESGGAEHVVDAPIGKSVMQIAVDHMVSGVVGACGGCLSCATCHGYIEGPVFSKLLAKEDDEVMMLDGVADVRENSRLTCQIIMQPELDGLVIRLPQEQF